MIQGGRQESVWASLSSHGHAAPPSLRLLPSSIPQLSRENLSQLLAFPSTAAVWGAQHVAWRVSGSPRAALTPRAFEFIESFLGSHDAISCGAPLQDTPGACSSCPQPSAFSDFLEVRNIRAQPLHENVTFGFCAGLRSVTLVSCERNRPGARGRVRHRVCACRLGCRCSIKPSARGRCSVPSRSVLYQLQLKLSSRVVSLRV